MNRIVCCFDEGDSETLGEEKACRYLKHWKISSEVLDSLIANAEKKYPGIPSKVLRVVDAMLNLGN